MRPDKIDPQSKCTVRKALPSDAPALARLSTLLGYPTTPQQVIYRLAHITSQDSQVIFVAEGSSGVTGFVHVHISTLLMVEPFAEIGALVVDEVQRGKGVGRALMERAQTWARQCGLESVNVRSNRVRSGAKGFYLHLGYSLVKTQNIFQKTI